MLRAIAIMKAVKGDKKRQKATRSDMLNTNIDNNDNAFNDEHELPYLLR